MKTILPRICNVLRELADSMPPGEERGRFEAAITGFRVRLMALPQRVASFVPFASGPEANEVMTREINDFF